MEITFSLQHKNRAYIVHAEYRDALAHTVNITVCDGGNNPLKSWRAVPSVSDYVMSGKPRELENEAKRMVKSRIDFDARAEF